MPDLAQARSMEEFRTALYELEGRYWHSHPFHEDMHGGRLGLLAVSSGFGDQLVIK